MLFLGPYESAPVPLATEGSMLLLGLGFQIMGVSHSHSRPSLWALFRQQPGFRHGDFLRLSGEEHGKESRALNDQEKPSPTTWNIRLRSSHKKNTNIFVIQSNAFLDLLLTLTSTETIVSVTVNFSSGNVHVSVTSSEICLHTGNSKNQKCHYFKPSNHSLQSTYLHFYMHCLYLYMLQSLNQNPKANLHTHEVYCAPAVT